MRFTKGLAIGQVFIYVLVALTFSVIMIFGYKSITEFVQRGEEVQFYQFKTDLESSIQRIYTEYKSVRESTFYVPARYTRICFVDVSKDPDDRLQAEDPLAFNAWKTVNADATTRSLDSYNIATENVFLTPPASDKIKVHQISIASSVPSAPGFLCKEIKNGAFTLTMEGKGDKTQLS